MSADANVLGAVLTGQEEAILEDWVRLQLASAGRRADQIDERTLREQSRQFLSAFRSSWSSGGRDVDAPGWAEARQVLGDMARDRARMGFSPTETATFVFSLKQPLFARVQEAAGAASGMADQTWAINLILDRLGLW